MQSCHWNTIIIAEKLLNAKPIRSVSYAEYMREKSVCSSLGSREDESLGSSPNMIYHSESTNKLTNRFVKLENTIEKSEIPEWLKNDIKEADFIPIEELNKKDQKPSISDSIFNKICEYETSYKVKEKLCFDLNKIF